MADNKVAFERNSCPWCHSAGRIAGKEAVEYQKSGRLPKDEVVSVRQTRLALVTPGGLTAVSIPCLLYHYDNCVVCGREYLFLVVRESRRPEEILVPLLMQQPRPHGNVPRRR